MSTACVVRYDAFKMGTHDDVVTALGPAVQVTSRPFSGAVEQRWDVGNARYRPLG